MLRRSDPTRPLVLTVADLAPEPLSHRVTRGGVTIDLTPKECAILVQIVDLEGRVLARSTNLGSVRLPASPGLLERLRSNEQVLETLRDFGDEPVRMLSAPIRVGDATYAIQVAGSLGAVIVSVSDSGPGVTEEEIPRLFERFYRGSAARRTEVPGTGLGLAISRILAESQGGGVSVASGAGGGAIVRVRLPLAA